MKIKANLRQSPFSFSINDYFDFKSIYCLISLSNFTNNEEAIDRLKFSLGNAGNESVILPFRIREIGVNLFKLVYNTRDRTVGTTFNIYTLIHFSVGSLFITMKIKGYLKNTE